MPQASIYFMFIHEAPYRTRNECQDKVTSFVFIVYFGNFICLNKPLVTTAQFIYELMQSILSDYAQAL